MTPEREAAIRAYTALNERDAWPAPAYLEEVLEALDRSRERVAAALWSLKMIRTSAVVYSPQGLRQLIDDTIAVLSE